MVTECQVRKLRRFLDRGTFLAQAAGRTRMSEKTARHYRDDRALPSERRRQKPPRTYRTRIDPFAAVWAEVEAQLRAEPKLAAKTLVRLAPRPTPRPVPRFALAHVRTPGAAVAGQRRAGPARDLPAGPLCGAKLWSHLLPN